MSVCRRSVAFRVGLVLLCAFTPVFAQSASEIPPNLAAVEARLRSSVPADVAWGAFLAAQFQLDDAVSSIVERLQSLPDADRNVRHHMTSAVLDSLIQLNARVPAPILVPFYREWPIHTLVLLGAASEERAATMLTLLHEARGHRWYALANLLLETKPPGVPAVILRGLRLTLSVTVSDSGDRAIGGGGMGSGHGDGIGQLPEGFPPYAHYSFGGARGSIVLAPGPTPVYYTRIVRNSFQCAVGNSEISGPTDEERLEYLGELLAPSRVRVHATTRVFLRWMNEERFRAEVKSAREELSQRYERLIRALLESRRLTESEARILPAQIDVRLSDERDNRVRPLPAID